MRNLFITICLFSVVALSSFNYDKKELSGCGGYFYAVNEPNMDGRVYVSEVFGRYKTVKVTNNGYPVGPFSDYDYAKDKREQFIRSLKQPGGKSYGGGYSVQYKYTECK